MPWLTRKSIEQLQAEANITGEHSLRRVLGPWNLVALGVGSIIGAGIFVLTGVAAAEYAGPGIMLSFIVAGIACALAALCYSELASMMPVAGSAYTYAYATLGEFIAWNIGWNLALGYGLGPATVAVGWSGYVVSLLRNFGIVIQPALTAPPGTTLVETSPGHWEALATVGRSLAQQGIDPSTLAHSVALVNLPAMLIVLLVTVVLVVGIRESVAVNAVAVVIKLVVLIAFIALGIAAIRTEHWHPLIPTNTGEWGHFGLSGVFRGAGVVFFAYIGFDAVSAVAQEARCPRRDLPIGILCSLGICTILYILVAAVLTGVVPYWRLNVPDPLSLGVDATGVAWLSPVVGIGIVAGLTSVILVDLLAQVRVLYAMAYDGLLPGWAARIHLRFRTPHVTTLVSGLVVATAAAFTPIDVLGELVSMGVLCAFAVVCGSVVVLRKTSPATERPFRVPLSPLLPALGVLGCGVLMYSLSYRTWCGLIVWMLIGSVLYVVYGRHHSVAGKTALSGIRRLP